jgi:hypothetical protein
MSIFLQAYQVSFKYMIFQKFPTWSLMEIYPQLQLEQPFDTPHLLPYYPQNEANGLRMQTFGLVSSCVGALLLRAAHPEFGV